VIEAVDTLSVIMLDSISMVVTGHVVFILLLSAEVNASSMSQCKSKVEKIKRFQSI